MIVPFAAAAAVFHLASPNIFDPDSFYYIRLAWIYRTRGLLDVEFPWMPYSVIKDLSSSLWYGFALFLVPFTYFDDLVVGIKATGVLLTAGALWIYYLVVRRSRLRMAPLWPFLLFFSTPNVLTQFLMVRPQLYVIPSHHVPGSNIFQRAATGIIVGVFLFVAFDSSQKTVASFSHSALPPDRLRSAGLWLREHSQPGDVVFNLRWAHFSSLFFWNQQNYYVAGLDPIFQYAYDPRLYWKFHHLAANESIQSTCGAPVCAREELEGTYEVLVNDFKAKYVVVGQQSHPALYHFFEGDPRFQKTLETPRGEAVYRIEHR